MFYNILCFEGLNLEVLSPLSLMLVSLEHETIWLITLKL